jgi:hypothetical protein
MDGIPKVDNPLHCRVANIRRNQVLLAGTFVALVGVALAAVTVFRNDAVPSLYATVCRQMESAERTERGVTDGGLGSSLEVSPRCIARDVWTIALLVILLNEHHMI